jgi:two-component system response regulator ChvI
MRELIARVKVLLRRAALSAQPPLGTPGEEERILETGGLRLDLRRYRAHWREAEIPLTVTEFTLLHALVRHPGHVKSRAQLLEEGYPHDAYVSDRTIDRHIQRRRKKIAEAAPEEELIETVYGLGYRFRER